MPSLSLRPMTAVEFGAYRARLIPEYAADNVAAGRWTAEEAEERSARDFDALMPDGAATAKMPVFVAADADGRRVGVLWLGLDFPRRGSAWIYDIEVDAEHRGKGFGRALLTAAEVEARRRGAETMGLQVFSRNAVARSLYESAGYEPATVVMRKPLD